MASASWSPFFEGSLQRRQGRKEGRGGREVQEGEGVGSGHPLGLNLAFWEVFSSPSFNYAVKYCRDGCPAFHFASSQIYNPSSVSTNIPLMNIYCMPGRRCGDTAGSNGSLQEHLGGSGISYGTREKAQHIKWSKLSGMRLGRLCAQEIKQCWRQWPCILRPEIVFQLFGSGSRFSALWRTQSITSSCLHSIQHGHMYFSITDPMSSLNQRAKKGRQKGDLDFWQRISPKEPLADLAAVREFLWEQWNRSSPCAY